MKKYLVFLALVVSTSTLGGCFVSGFDWRDIVGGQTLRFETTGYPPDSFILSFSYSGEYYEKIDNGQVKGRYNYYRESDYGSSYEVEFRKIGSWSTDTLIIHEHGLVEFEGYIDRKTTERTKSDT